MKKIIKKPSLIEDWKNGLKWISVHCMVLATSIQATWMYLPPEFSSRLPEKVINIISIILLISGIIGRFVKQENKSNGNESKPT